MAPFRAESDVALTPHRLQLNVVDHKGNVALRFRKELECAIQRADHEREERHHAPHRSGRGIA